MKQQQQQQFSRKISNTGTSQNNSCFKTQIGFQQVIKNPASLNLLANNNLDLRLSCQQQLFDRYDEPQNGLDDPFSIQGLNTWKINIERHQSGDIDLGKILKNQTLDSKQIPSSTTQKSATDERGITLNIINQILSENKVSKRMSICEKMAMKKQTVESDKQKIKSLNETNSDVYKIYNDKKEKEINTIKATQQQCNKKILNMIIYNKLKRQLKQSDLTIKDIENNQQKIQNIENDAKDSILSFMAANEMLRYNKDSIQYEQILNKIIQEKNAPKKLFEFTQELKKMEKENNDYPVIERTILQKSKVLDNDINDKKSQQITDFNKLYKLQQEYQKYEQQIDELKSKLQNEWQLHEKKNFQSPSSNYKSKNKFLFSQAQTEFVHQEQIRFNQFVENNEQQQEEIRKKQALLFQQIIRLKSTLQVSDNYLKSLRKDKQLLRLKLKDYYQNFMKKGIYNSENSIIDIVRLYLKMGQIIQYTDFPQELDHENQEFIIHQAQTVNALEVLDAKKQELIRKKQQLQAGSNPTFPTESDYQNIKQQTEEIKQKLSQLNTTSSVKRNIFILSENESEYNASSQAVSNQDLTSKLAKKTPKHMLNGDMVNFSNQLSNLLLEIEKHKNYSKRLEQVEVERIFQNYCQKLTTVHDRQALAQRFAVILTMLFGTQKSQDIMQRFDLQSKIFLIKSKKLNSPPNSQNAPSLIEQSGYKCVQSPSCPTQPNAGANSPKSSGSSNGNNVSTVLKTQSMQDQIDSYNKQNQQALQPYLFSASRGFSDIFFNNRQYSQSNISKQSQDSTKFSKEFLSPQNYSTMTEKKWFKGQEKQHESQSLLGVSNSNSVFKKQPLHINLSEFNSKNNSNYIPNIHKNKANSNNVSNIIISQKNNLVGFNDYTTYSKNNNCNFSQICTTPLSKISKKRQFQI